MKGKNERKENKAKTNIGALSGMRLVKRWFLHIQDIWAADLAKMMKIICVSYSSLLAKLDNIAI